MSAPTPAGTHDLRPDPQEVRTVTVVGTGVIGGGWAAHFLRMGYDVVAWDPGPDAESRLRTLVDTAWPALTRLGLREGASPDRLTVAGSLTDALAGADFVQESSPEVLEAKVALLAAIDAATPAGVVVGSSTSGFAMSAMAVDCETPGRFVVGHPFNPPYLVPLVEVVGGDATDASTVDWAEAFYAHAGKTVLRMEDEVPGFVGNRLQEALWREALHMVGSGQATVQQVDDSITYGPGLRWPLMGPMLTFHLAGGRGGMAHMLDHFGPALLEPWTRLDAPELTPALRDAVVAGADGVAAGRSVVDLERARDEFLVDLLALLERHRTPATGPTPVAAAGTGGGSGGPFSSYAVVVPEEWTDYNGHVHDACYVTALSDANEEVFAALGLSVGYRAETGASFYTVDHHVRYVAECSAGDRLTASTLLVAADLKRIRLATDLVRGDGTVVAAAESLYLHVDGATGRVRELPEERWAPVAAMLRAHAGHAARADGAHQSQRAGR